MYWSLLVHGRVQGGRVPGGGREPEHDREREQVRGREQAREDGREPGQGRGKGREQELGEPHMGLGGEEGQPLGEGGGQPGQSRGWGGLGQQLRAPGRGVLRGAYGLRERQLCRVRGSLDGWTGQRRQPPPGQKQRQRSAKSNDRYLLVHFYSIHILLLIWWCRL